MGGNFELASAWLQLHRIFEVYEIGKCPLNGHFEFLCMCFFSRSRGVLRGCEWRGNSNWLALGMQTH